MTNGFKGTPNYHGMGGDYARVTDFYDCVMIHTFDPSAREAATIGMTPEQARTLAQGIIAAADRAEGKQ